MHGTLVVLTGLIGAATHQEPSFGDADHRRLGKFRGPGGGVMEKFAHRQTKNGVLRATGQHNAAITRAGLKRAKTDAN
jgi:hypothetical protein